MCKNMNEIAGKNVAATSGCHAIAAYPDIVRIKTEDGKEFITERVPYDICFAELKPYLRSLEEFDKCTDVMAKRVRICNYAEKKMCVSTETLEAVLAGFDAALNAYQQRKEEISGFINQLECEVARKVLTERYLNYTSWNSIAEMLGVDKRRVKVIHSFALKELYEIMCYAAEEAYADLV